MEYRLAVGDDILTFGVERRPDGGLSITRDGCAFDVDYSAISKHHFHLVVNGVGFNACVAPDGRGKCVIIRGTPYYLEDADRRVTAGKGARDAPAEVVAPMPAVVVGVFVSEGDRVKQGDRVLVVSAMKMETTLTAPRDGRVMAVKVAVGDKVMPGRILVDIEKDNEPTTDKIV